MPAVIVNALFWGVIWYFFPGTLAEFVELLPLWGLVAGGPVVAGAMAFSSVSVLSNSLLFRRYIPDHDYELLG